MSFSLFTANRTLIFAINVTLSCIRSRFLFLLAKTGDDGTSQFSGWTAPTQKSGTVVIISNTKLSQLT